MGRNIKFLTFPSPQSRQYSPLVHLKHNGKKVGYELNFQSTPKTKTVRYTLLLPNQYGEEGLGKKSGGYTHIKFTQIQP